MVSAYYHFLFPSSDKPGFLVKEWRSRLPFSDYENIQANLATFIEHMFSQFKVSGKSINWKSHYKSFEDKEDVLFLRYEDLLSDPGVELKKTLKHLRVAEVSNESIELAVDSYDFKTLARRSRGEENNYSFLRKGVTGDWKNTFNSKSCETFNRLAGDVLIKLGYEQDHNWY